MAGSLNKVTLIGNLGRDPEIRNTQTGGKVANFSIATSESWKDRNSGEKRERTEWHRVVVFSEGLVGVIESYVKKGSKVFVEGQLQTRKWTDQQGSERYTTEVVLKAFDARLILLDGRRDGGAPPPPGDPSDYGSGQAGGQTAGYGSGQGATRPIDDDIPF